MVPSIGAVRVSSIFIASSTSSLAPLRHDVAGLHQDAGDAGGDRGGQAAVARGSVLGRRQRIDPVQHVVSAADDDDQRLILPHHTQPVHHPVQPQCRAIGRRLRLHRAAGQVQLEPGAARMGAQGDGRLALAQRHVLVAIAVHAPCVAWFHGDPASSDGAAMLRSASAASAAAAQTTASLEGSSANSAGAWRAMNPVSSAPPRRPGARRWRAAGRGCCARRPPRSPPAPRQPAHRGGPVRAPDDQLGDHRVVMRRDRVALPHAGVHPHMRAVRAARADAAACRWRAGSRAPGPRHRAAPRSRGRRCAARPAQRQRLAGGDAQLPLHQILAGDHLGDRMLDLQPRVHLHEVEGVALGDELHRAGADVADRAGGGDRGLAHRRRRAGPCRARALPPPPSGGAAGSSSRVRTARRCCRACRRTPGSRCAGGASGSARSAPGRRRRRRAPRACARPARRRTPSACSTTRMPLPPPPADALISTG